MKKIMFIVCSILFASTVFSQENNPRLKDAEDIYKSFEIDIIGARGAVQVSQLADVAQMKYSRMIIAQNEEIIALLKQLTGRNKSSTSERSSK